MSHRGSGHGAKLPRILPAPQPQYTGSQRNRQESDSDSIPPPGNRSQKRAKVTPVACQPCQQRKSKCDGVRPTCTACLIKKRQDCVYDSAGDQRRTTALKEQIKSLKVETQNLRDIITAICTSADRDVLIDQVVATLLRQNFEFVAEVAEVCRRNTQEPVGGLPRAGLQLRDAAANAGPSFTQQDGLYGQSYAPKRYMDGVDGVTPPLAPPGWAGGMEDVDGVEVDGDEEITEGDEDSYARRRPRYHPNPGWEYSDP